MPCWQMHFSKYAIREWGHHSLNQIYLIESTKRQRLLGLIRYKKIIWLRNTAWIKGILQAHKPRPSAFLCFQWTTLLLFCFRRIHWQDKIFFVFLSHLICNVYLYLLSTATRTAGNCILNYTDTLNAQLGAKWNKYVIRKIVYWSYWCIWWGFLFGLTRQR